MEIALIAKKEKKKKQEYASWRVIYFMTWDTHCPSKSSILNAEAATSNKSHSELLGHEWDRGGHFCNFL